ncbi:DUF397 domain-containing protein [Streptomyces sp. NBC_00487]|uniref:DUF397 domain-containing protein n=1 Tax=unclassified Streptomyces TaxID=2593676 RepID=UPI002E185123|nr:MULTISPECIES: DUF397 domain-containing protein [unclassified Streptomyces]
MSTTELAWFKSSYSSGSGDDCVEVALSWHKSSHSSDFEDACVEMASCSDTIHVRDSKVRQGSQLVLAPETWTAFLKYATQA